jgi:hypothetical protein
MEQSMESETMASGEIRQILANVHETNVAQLRLLKKQLNLARLTSLILIVALGFLLYYLGSTYARISTTLEDIQVVSSDLAAADLPKMIENVNTLVSSGQQSILVATEKIEKIDIDALNQSIRDLNSIIAPLARLFGGQ